MASLIKVKSGALVTQLRRVNSGLKIGRPLTIRGLKYEIIAIPAGLNYPIHRPNKLSFLVRFRNKNVQSRACETAGLAASALGRG